MNEKIEHLHTGSIERVADWRIGPHRHEFSELVVPIRGTLNVAVDGVVSKFGFGSVVLYPAGLVHEEWAEEGDAFESCFTAFKGPCGVVGGLASIDDPGGRVRQIVRWLLQDCRAFGMEAGGAAGMMVALALRIFNTGSPPSEDERIRKVRDYARRHMSERITLADLARSAGMSRCHFAREYRRLTGRTPMVDVRRMRADYARDLILSTNLPIKAVALASGLGNEYMLSRLFRKLYGNPPGELRRRHACFRG